MKKKNLKNLQLNKKAISLLHNSSINGGGSNQCTEFDLCWLTTKGIYLCNDCS